MHYASNLSTQSWGGGAAGAGRWVQGAREGELRTYGGSLSSDMTFSQLLEFEQS